MTPTPACAAAHSTVKVASVLVLNTRSGSCPVGPGIAARWITASTPAQRVGHHIRRGHVAHNDSLHVEIAWIVEHHGRDPMSGCAEVGHHGSPRSEERRVGTDRRDEAATGGDETRRG